MQPGAAVTRSRESSSYYRRRRGAVGPFLPPDSGPRLRYIPRRNPVRFAQGVLPSSFRFAAAHPPSGTDRHRTRRSPSRALPLPVPRLLSLRLRSLPPSLNRTSVLQGMAHPKPLGLRGIGTASALRCGRLPRRMRDLPLSLILARLPLRTSGRLLVTRLQVTESAPPIIPTDIATPAAPTQPIGLAVARPLALRLR